MVEEEVRAYALFSVSGRVKNPGVHLAPAGISVMELIDEYCGGMLDGHKLYGFFPGGASGGILSAEHKDEPLDFGTLNKTGCFIGSAAIIVLSDKDKARDYALNAMKFLSEKVAVNALLAELVQKKLPC